MAIDRSDPELDAICERLIATSRAHGCTCVVPKLHDRDEIVGEMEDQTPQAQTMVKAALMQTWPRVEVFIDHWPGCYLFQLRWAPYN